MVSEFELLLKIADISKFKRMKFTTIQLSNLLDVSQQTISRKLRLLEDKKWISRDSKFEGIHIQITQEGKTILHEKFNLLKELFTKLRYELHGKISSGLGEGKYYMGLKGYQESIQKALGFVPYEGTLNLKVDESLISSFLFHMTKIEIPGFFDGERTYGGINAYKIMIENKIFGAIIIPERTHHRKNIIEIISEKNLRNELALNEDDELVVKPDEKN